MAKVGDRIVMMGKTKNATSRDRSGVIEQVLNEDPPRYLVRWDAGSSTVLSPNPGTIRFEAAQPSARQRAKAQRPATKKAAKR
jgi:hypothetical protein